MCAGATSPKAIPRPYRQEAELSRGKQVQAGQAAHKRPQHHPPTAIPAFEQRQVVVSQSAKTEEGIGMKERHEFQICKQILCQAKRVYRFNVAPTCRTIHSVLNNEQVEKFDS